MATSKAFKFWVSHTAISACARCWPSACACEDERCNLWSLAPPRESGRINDFASTTQPVSPCPHGPSSPGGEGWSPNSGGLLCISSTLLGWSTHFTKSPWKNWMDVTIWHIIQNLECHALPLTHFIVWNLTQNLVWRGWKKPMWSSPCPDIESAPRNKKRYEAQNTRPFWLNSSTIGSSYHWSTVMRNKKLIHLGTETGL